MEFSDFTLKFDQKENKKELLSQKGPKYNAIDKTHIGKYS